MLSEWTIDPGSLDAADPNEMTDFNMFTLNGRVFPGTESLVGAGRRARAHPRRQSRR